MKINNVQWCSEIKNINIAGGKDPKPACIDGSSTRESLLQRIARQLSARRLSAPWVPPVFPTEAPLSASLHLHIRDDNNSNINSNNCKQSDNLSGLDYKGCPHEDMYNVDYSRAVDILGEYNVD